MSVIPKVKLSQPHIEQIHKDVELALTEIGVVVVKARAAEEKEILDCAERTEYLLRSIQQSLPPKQMELPF